MYESISDSSNPFTKTGLSREVHGLLSVVEAGDASGLDLVVTSTTDHPQYTNSGNLSRHVMEGTDGKGLAIDGRMRQRGISPGQHRPFFDLWLPYESRLHELIYAYPPSGRRADGSFGPYNIKAGRRVAPYAVSDHKDHVHNSVSKGVIIAASKEAAMKFVDVVDWLQTPDGRGAWGLLKDGGVVTVGGAPFYGSYAKGLIEGWEAKKLFPYLGGYMFLNGDLAEYHFPKK